MVGFKKSSLLTCVAIRGHMDCSYTELGTPELIRLILTLILELARRFGVGIHQHTHSLQWNSVHDQLDRAHLAYEQHSVVILSVRFVVVTSSALDPKKVTAITGVVSIVGYNSRGEL